MSREGRAYGTSRGDPLRAYFLVGSTAVGKSEVAQWLAERHDYDLLSADSMLVYEQMDIGTAKPAARDRERVATYGIDLTTPDKPFSAWAFRQYARDVIARAAAARRRVLVVGGSGLYIKSLTDGLAPGPGELPAGRRAWLRKLDEEGIGALQRELRDRSPNVYEALDDPQNARRLIRALEQVCGGAREPRRTWQARGPSAPLAGLTRDDAELKARIAARVAAMFRAGFVDEVRGLLARFGRLSATARQAIGYSEVIAYLEGRCSLEEAIERATVRTRQLAKRQRTWLRHQAEVTWIGLDARTTVREAGERVAAHWRQYGPTDIAD